MNKAALFSLTALIGFACAAPTEGEGGDGDGDGLMYGDGDGDGQMNTGGLVTGSGGVAGVTGGTTGSSGGAPVTGSGGAVGSGGTPAASGGAPPVGATCSAASFTATAGYADNGQMCGFVWTAKFPETDAAVTITPPCTMSDGSDCFMTDLCTTATVPASTAEPAYYPGVIIGWNVAQDAAGGTNGTWTASGTGLTPTFTTTGTGEVRVVITSGGSEYCAPATSGVAIPWGSFTVDCWEAGGAALSAGSAISQVMLQLNAGATAQTAVDFCLSGYAVN